MWYKKIFSTLLYIVIIFVALIFPRQTDIAATISEKRGNTDGNIVNGGFAAEENSWIYYASNSGIWKIKNDGTEKTWLVEDKASFLNVLDGWLYYIGGGNETNRGIYKIRTDGSGKALLVNETTVTMSVIGNNIYYVSYGKPSQEVQPSLYKIDTSGKNKTLILSEQFINLDSINVQENKIYYISETNLASFNIDGSKKQLVAGDVFHNVIIRGNWAYYISFGLRQSDALYMTRSGSLEKRFVTENVGSFNINKDIIFYAKLEKQTKHKETDSDGNEVIFFNEKSPVSLNKINLDGSNDLKLVDGVINQINLAGDWIFYSTYPSKTGEVKLYKMKMDGTEEQEVV